jgi:hypothetical protein
VNCCENPQLILQAFLQAALNIDHGEFCEKGDNIQTKRRSFEIGLPSQSSDVTDDVRVPRSIFGNTNHMNVTSQISTTGVQSRNSLHTCDPLRINTSLFGRPGLTNHPSRRDRIISAISEANTPVLPAPCKLADFQRHSDITSQMTSETVTPCRPATSVMETSCNITPYSGKTFAFKPGTKTSPIMLLALPSKSTSPVIPHEDGKSDLAIVSEIEQDNLSLGKGNSSRGTLAATKQHKMPRNTLQGSVPACGETCTVLDDQLLFKISDDTWEYDLDLSLEKITTWQAGERDTSMVNKQVKGDNHPPIENISVSEMCTTPLCTTKNSTSQQHRDNNIEMITTPFHTPYSSTNRAPALQSSIRQTNVRNASEKRTVADLSSVFQRETPLPQSSPTTPAESSKFLPVIETPSSSRAGSCSSLKRKRKFPGPAGVLPKLVCMHTIYRKPLSYMLQN